MKKPGILLIGFATAALTFGTLFMTLGPKDHSSCHHKADAEKTEKVETE